MRWLVLIALSFAFGSGACGDEFLPGDGGSGAGQSEQSCVSVNDCDPPTDPCIQLSCQNNRCTYVQAKDQTPVAETEQVPGDCQIRICLQGAVVSRNSDDPPPDEPCLEYYCEDGEVQQVALGSEVSCGVGGTQFCNGAGQCVGCTVDDDCGTHPGPCSTFRCVGDVCEVQSITNAPSPKQTPEDCQTVRCDARGMPVQDVDEGDVPVDADLLDCIAPICTFDGMIDSEPLPDGDTCGEAADNRQCCGGTCCDLGQTCDTGSSTCQ